MKVYDNFYITKNTPIEAIRSSKVISMGVFNHENSKTVNLREKKFKT